jgi:hypothetical protein
MASGIVSQMSLDAREGGEGSAGEGTGSAMRVDGSVGSGVSGGGVSRSDTESLAGMVEWYGAASVSAQGRSETCPVNLPTPGGTSAIPVARIRDSLKAAGLAEG